MFASRSLLMRRESRLDENTHHRHFLADYRLRRRRWRISEEFFWTPPFKLSKRACALAGRMARHLPLSSDTDYDYKWHS